MEKVSTYRELKKALKPDGQESGTICGFIQFEEKKIYVRKHWSYDGGFPCYSDEDCLQSVGELFPDGNWFPYKIDGVQQLRHGCIELQDSKLIFKPE